MRQSFWGIYNPAHKASLLASDIASIALAFYLASEYRLGVSPSYYSLEYIALSLIIVSCLFLGNGYTSMGIGSKPRLPLNTLLVVFMSALPCAVFIYLMGPERFTNLFGRGIFPFAVGLIGVFAMLNRLIFNRFFNTRDNDKKILIVGDNQTCDFVNNTFIDSKINIIFTRVSALTDSILDDHHDSIVICPEHRACENEQQLLLKLRLSGTPIFSLSDFFESFLFLIPVNKINNDWFIRSEGFTMLHNAVTVRIKRASDILFSITLIFISVPIMILCAIAIKCSSRGTILFSQKRIGLNGKPFIIYKFRTMDTNAEDNGPQWAESNDVRIFPLGKFLRKCRIDELPQCWNILRGEMSLVGPRPERPEFTSQLAEKIPFYDLRHIVKPGLTGWAQVSYPYGASIEDSLRKLQYDLYYIKNYSIILDINILLRTVLVTLRRGGR